MPDTSATNSATIYALASEDQPNRLRYIGKTSKPLRCRLSQHIREVNRWQTPKNDWLNSLTRRGIRPIIWPLEQCSNESWEERERFWIRLFRPMKGFLNVSDGGNTGPSRKGSKISEETRQKLLNRKPWKHSEETKARMSIAARKRKKTPAMRLRQSLRQRGIAPMWATAKAKEKNTGAKRSPEVVARIRAGLLASPTFFKRLKPVRCITTNKAFESIKQASITTGLKGYNIARAIVRGTRCGRMEWEAL